MHTLSYHVGTLIVVERTLSYPPYLSIYQGIQQPLHPKYACNTTDHTTHGYCDTCYCVVCKKSPTECREWGTHFEFGLSFVINRAEGKAPAPGHEFDPMDFCLEAPTDHGPSTSDENVAGAGAGAGAGAAGAGAGAGAVGAGAVAAGAGAGAVGAGATSPNMVQYAGMKERMEASTQASTIAKKHHENAKRKKTSGKKRSPYKKWSDEEDVQLLAAINSNKGVLSSELMNDLMKTFNASKGQVQSRGHMLRTKRKAGTTDDENTHSAKKKKKCIKVEAGLNSSA